MAICIVDLTLSEREFFFFFCLFFVVVAICLEMHFSGVPVVAQWLTNPTRNHEVAGSVPALAQWVNDLALP